MDPGSSKTETRTAVMDDAMRFESPGSLNKTPLQMLEEEIEQVIKVDPKTMLCHILDVIGTCDPPIVSETDLGVEGVKVSIKLDLTFHQKTISLVVNGDAEMDKSSAEYSAFMMAFKQIEQHCHVRLIDFSSRVARSFGAYNTYDHVNEAMDAVPRLLNGFESTLSDCKDLSLQLDREEVKAKLNGNQHDDGHVYAVLSQFLGTVVQRFSDKSSNIRSKINSLEFERMKHHERAKQKAQDMFMKCYTKPVVFTCRVLLDYVLSFFGFEKAKYSNGPACNGMVEAVVKFKVPYFEHHKYGGKLTIKGKGITSTNAEEDAAYKALLLFEEDFKVQIVDINRSHRVEAENVQIMLVRMLGEILELAEVIKDMWSKLLKALEEQSEHHRYESSRLAPTSNAQHLIAACQFCTDGLARIEQDSLKSFNACATLFDMMEKITCNLSVIKIKLNIV